MCFPLPTPDICESVSESYDDNKHGVHLECYKRFASEVYAFFCHKKFVSLLQPVNILTL